MGGIGVSQALVPERYPEYGGDDEFKKIRASLPEEIIENDKKTGVAMY